MTVVPILPSSTWRRAIAPLLYLLLAALPAIALRPDRLPNQYRRVVWNNLNGMPQSGAQALAQTADGYLWIGTQEGLVRFDGVRFTVFDKANTPQFPEQYIQGLAASAADGSLWGATSTGLFQGRAGVFRLVSQQETPCAVRPITLRAETDGSVWVGTQQGLVCRFSKDGGGWQTLTPPGNKALVRAILRAADGAMWVGTGSGAWRYSKGGWQRYGEPEGLPSGVVRCLVQRRDGTLLAGTARGIAVFGGMRFRPWGADAPALRSVVSALHEDRHGNLWVANWPSGLARLAPSGELARLEDGPGTESPVMSLLEDREGNLWVGTGAEGAVMLDDTKMVPFGAPQGIASRVAWSVMEDRAGDLWITTRDGVKKLGQGKRVVPVPAALTNRRTGALLEDRHGDIWVGIATGVARVRNGQVSEWRLPDRPDGRVVTALAERDEGGLWMGTADQGLFVLQDGRLTPDEDYPDRKVNLFFHTADGRLWVGGSMAGLLYREGGRWRRYEAVTESAVYGAWEDRAAGALWLVTGGGGVKRIRNGKVDTVGIAHGLCSATNYSILHDGRGYFWMGSVHGVARVPVADMEAVADGRSTRVACSWRGVADGMLYPECSGGVSPAAWKGRDGRLWFPTQGVVAVVPDDDDHAKLVPQPLLESAEYGPGRAVPATLPLGERDVEFRYTAPGMAHPFELKLQYRLAGYDSGWQDGSQRVARYTNLPPGSYTFEMKVADREGQWGLPQVLRTLEIPPYFRETGWFTLTMGVGMLGLAAAGVQLRTRQVRARQAELERLVEERTAEARNAARAKSDFLANMSHEIRTPMAATVGTTDLLMELDLPAEAKEHLATIRASGESLLTLINDILDLSKIDAGKLQLEHRRFHLIDCLEDVMALVSIHAQGKNLALSDEIAPDVPEWIEGDPTRLRQILLNLLSNAIKFTALGSVRLSVRAAEQAATTLHFAVQDSGIGISAEGQAKLFQEFSQADSSTTRRFGGTGLGLAISKRLVEALGGRIWVDSREGEGAMFHFTLPLGPPPTPAEAPAPRAARILLLLADAKGLQQRLARLGFGNVRKADYGAVAGWTGPERAFEFVFADESIATAAGEAAARLLRAAYAGVKIVEVASHRAALPRPGVTDAVLISPFRTSALRQVLAIEPSVRGESAGESLEQLAKRLPLRVLLAEDNKVNQRVVLRMLERLGYQADLAVNGRQAMEKVRELPYDLVLMDVHMPEMDGLEACRQIQRELPGERRPRVVALTASAFDDSRDACLAAGMQGFLSKPLRLKELAAAIEEFGPKRDG